MLAKAAASLDLLTQGHVELGLGAGAFWEPIAAMGGPHRFTRKSVSVLSEACVSARPSAIASTNWAYVTPGAAPCAVSLSTTPGQSALTVISLGRQCLRGRPREGPGPPNLSRGAPLGCARQTQPVGCHM
jgi:hypothetical protein